jgi:hypothetical protein
VQVGIRRVPPWTVLDAGELQLKLQLSRPVTKVTIIAQPGRLDTRLISGAQHRETLGAKARSPTTTAG